MSQAPSKKLNSLTEGSIVTSLVRLSIPIILANILQTVYQLTDTFWVGRLGTEAVAAVSISFPIIFLIISLGVGLAMAGTILASQYTGKGDQDSVNHVSTQTLLIVAWISAVLSVIGYLVSPYLIAFMGAEPSVFDSAVSYMQITFIGLIFMFSFMVYQSLMRGVGDVKTPVYIVLVTVLLNFIFDPLFIFGYGSVPAFGVSGAAVATVGTQGIAAIIGLAILIKGNHSIQLHLVDLRPDWVLIKRMFKLGFPASVEQSTRALGMAVMTVLVTSFGTLALAAYGIGGRILSFVIIPAMGLSMATSTLVGQNIGANKLDRAVEVVKLSSVIGFISLSIIGVALYIFATQISAIFIPGELETIQSSALFIKLMSFTFGFIGIQMALTGALRGSGNTMASMMLSIISLWVLQFPLAYVLSHHTSLAVVGLWWAFPISNVAAAIITVIWISRGTWKKTQVTEQTKVEEAIVEEAIVEEGMNS